jgi:hypothetical protein
MSRILKIFNHPLSKTMLFGFWLVLFGLLLHRDYFVRTIDAGEAAALDRARRIEYQSIYFNKKKIGYVENHFTPVDVDRLEIKQKATMRLNISGQSHPVDLDLTAILGPSDNLETFTFDFSSPFYQMMAEGRVEGNRVSFSLDTGNSTIEDSVVLEEAPMLSTSRRSYLLGLGIEEGEKVKIPWFDPVSLTAKESMLEYRGQERVLINSRVYYLHRFTEHFAGSRINSWLDDEGNVIKEESPAGFVFVKEPEYKAKQLDSTSEDLLSSVSVKITGSLPDFRTRQKMRYRLVLPPDTEFDLDGGRQSFTDGILTVNLETVPTDVEENSTSTCEVREADLAASPYIQANAPKILELSQQLTDGHNSDVDRVEAIADWVYRTLDKRPVIGIPDALSTLQSKIGDCNEHASLFAALARAAGIPTRIAAGVVYNKGAFYYHAWNEVCVSGQWLSIDTTTNQIPADLSHIKFIEGELQEQIRIGSLLNVLEIEPLAD